MILSNFLIGLPAMLLCLILQVAVAFWCVRYYVRQAVDGPAPPGFLAGIRPLLVAMDSDGGSLYDAVRAGVNARRAQVLADLGVKPQ